MKGSFRIAREILRRSCRDHVRGVCEKHLRVMEALSNGDFAEIQRSGKLPPERMLLVSNDENAVRETVDFIRKLLQGPSEEVFEQHEITITKVGDGMSVATYREDVGRHGSGTT